MEHRFICTFKSRSVSYTHLDVYKRQIQFCGLNAQSRPWLYYVYEALAAAVFEETGRLIAMKFWMNKWLDFRNALMYGIGHGGVEAILIGGLSGISNLVSMLMINSGAMQNTLAALPAAVSYTHLDVYKRQVL